MIYERLIKHHDISTMPDEIYRELKDATIINIQNVFDYFYEINEKDRPDWRIDDDFPNIAPPFDNIYMEYRHHMIGKPVGIHCYSSEKFKIFDENVKLPFNEKWTSIYNVYWGDNPINISPISWAFSITDDGRVSRDEKTGMSCVWISPTISKHGIEPKGMDIIYNDNQYGEPIMRSGMIYPALLAISFMHCKNVELVDRGPQMKLGKRNRHGPRIKYYVLEIEPMKKVLRYEGKSEETGLKRALHICRGHFKDYRQRGLFGKYRDIFWWDSQVRGNLSEGLIAKDYSVNPNEKDDNP